MKSIFAPARLIVSRWAWFAVLPVIAVCSGATSTEVVPNPHPGTVSDLVVTAITDASATLTFTQVDDGTGSAARYDVRYAGAPIAWGAASAITSGTCATPMMGTGIGTSLSCTVLGLSPSTAYNFQLIAFRGTLQADATFGGLSNVAVASTAAPPAPPPPPPPPPPVVTSVAVSPASASVAVGATTQLQAAVKDAQGNVMPGEPVSWTTDNAAAATVNSSGLVTGVAAGSATITATSSGKSGTATITVTTTPPPPPVVTTVTISPNPASVVVGATVALSATVKDAQGNVMTGQSLTWSSNNTGVATVSSGGVVTGVAAGGATITASTSGKSGTSSLTVTSPPPPAPVVTTVTVAPGAPSIVAGTTVTLSATVRDAAGNVMTGQSVTWSTNNAAAATVNSAGVVTGVSAGSATITATCAGKTGTSNVTVSAPPPPPPPPPGGTLLFQEDFENSNLGSRGWYDNTGALLSTTEHVTGSNSSSQYRFLAGATGPTSGGAQRRKFTASNSVYVSYYVKYSTNWVGSNKPYHPHELYILSNLDGDWDGPSENYLDVYIEQNYLNGGRPRLAIQDNKSVNTSAGAVPNNLIGVTENRSTSGCNGIVETNMPSECYNAGTYWYNDKQLTGPVTFQPNPGSGYKNNWNFVEVYFQLNTIVNGVGQADGVMQYWFNGTLIIDRHDILYRTGARPTLQFNQFIIAPYIGDGSPVDQSMFIDNLRVATGRIP